MSSNDPKTIAGSYRQKSDTLQRFFTRPFFLSLTIGIPFCIFKLLFGITLVRIGPGYVSAGFSLRMGGDRMGTGGPDHEPGPRMV